MRKIVHAECEPFGDVHLYVATTRKQWNSLNEQFDGALENPTALGTTCTVEHTKRPTFAIVVWLDAAELGRKPTRRQISYITHEAVHVAQGVLDYIGEGRTIEVAAYLSDWAAPYLWDALNT